MYQEQSTKDEIPVSHDQQQPNTEYQSEVDQTSSYDLQNQPNTEYQSEVDQTSSYDLQNQPNTEYQPEVDQTSSYDLGEEPNTEYQPEVDQSSSYDLQQEPNTEYQPEVDQSSYDLGQQNEYEIPPIIPLPNTSQECRYRDEIIELKTDSLNNEIEISKIIQLKIQDTKHEPNFSYIIKTEPISINEITEKDEISTCNLSSDPNSEYILCEYANRPITIMSEFLNKKKTEVNDKKIIQMILDFHITLQEALIELYKTTNIIHNSINENNILISEESIPIIKNFGEAKQDEIQSNYIDIHSLAKSFLNIINNLSIQYETMMKYKESLEKIVNGEPNENSLLKIEEIHSFML